MKHSRVLGIYAHPDDADVGAGGILAMLARQGADVKVVVVTSGDAGGFQDQGQEEMPKVRREEQLHALHALGIDEVSFLDGYADGHVQEAQGLVKDLVAEIRRHQPSLILTMSPEYNWKSVAANHPDHRAVGDAVVQAVYPAARNPYAYPELLDAGLQPCTVDEVWFQGHQEPNRFVEIAAEDLERKIEAVRCHASQFSDLDAMEEYVRLTAMEVGNRHSSQEGSLAEEFFVWHSR